MEKKSLKGLILGALCLGIGGFISISAQAQSTGFRSVDRPAEFNLKVDLDPVFLPPKAYKLTPSDIPKLYEKGTFKKNPYFKWLTNAKTTSRALFKKKPAGNVELEMSILGGQVPVDELIVDFENGRFTGLMLSIHNPGDSGTIELKEFERRKNQIGGYLSKILKVKPRERKADVSKGVMTSGYTWTSSIGKAALEYNMEATKGDIQFFRLRLSRTQTGGIYKATMQDRSVATVRKSFLVKNVKKSGDTVWIPNVPMVDQGGKGYCVVASVQRIFEYYGISCDMHQLAQVAGADPEGGTSTLKANAEISKIDHRFKTHFKCVCIAFRGQLHELKDERRVGDVVSPGKFFRTIHSHIDNGIPLLWGLDIGLYDEKPPLKPEMKGGHMRIIIGYNKVKNQLVFTDPWGAGHETKTMDADDAIKATKGLFILKPTIN